MISKQIKGNSKDVIMKKTHMTEKYETKNNGLVFKGSKTSQVHLPKLR